MKKNMVKAVFIAAIVLVCGINVFNYQKSDTLSDIAMANVEALANDESEGIGSGSSGYVECCGDKKICTGNYCGLFLPAEGDKAITMYYKY